MVKRYVVVKRFLQIFGIKRRVDFKLLFHYKKCFLFAIKMMRKSNSQLNQDVFVACELRLWENSKRSRFFVEFGATDGMDYSNSYLFESFFGWDGIVVEPGKIWQESLTQNRNCNIDFRCVYENSRKKVLFNETPNAVLSTIKSFAENDMHSDIRKEGKEYYVETVSLSDLLQDYAAPKNIDYLSIDTEGSEYEILKNFNFKEYNFQVITVEHNYNQNRDRIYRLFVENGYKRILTEVSLYDDWYVLNEFEKNLGAVQNEKS